MLPCCWVNRLSHFPNQMNVTSGRPGCLFKPNVVDGLADLRRFQAFQ